jgi:asparagine synthase (glutamine-hydrolysing)
MRDSITGSSIVFNGEIYNFQALRDELIAAGQGFCTKSDTEVILIGYRQWGEAVFNRLRGMFAIALWDATQRRLLLVRDPVGKKPLVYGQCDGVFLFGSECKSLLTWPGLPREPDPVALHEFLTLQYVPAPRTGFRGLSRLMPGRIRIIGCDGREQERVYTQWSTPNEEHRSEPDLLAELRHLLEVSVRRRLVSDVPVGAFLSGGIDSAAVVATASHLSPTPLQTFCIGFSESAADERAEARVSAQHFGTMHREMEVTVDFAASLRDLAWFYDQPFADSSALATYAVAALARQYVSVALTGDGGDELFLGYTRYGDLAAHAGVERLPASLRYLSGRLAEMLPAGAEGWRAGRVLRRHLQALDVRNSRRYATTMAIFRDIDKQMGYGDFFGGQAYGSALDHWESWFAAAPDAVAGAAAADLHTYLPDGILHKVDIATMAHGLEARSPLLDYDLIQFAAALPSAMRMGGELKGLFKRALKPVLPAEILRRPKLGFGLPLEGWFRAGLDGYVEDLVLGDKARRRGLLQPEFTRRLWDEHRTGRMLHHPRLWALMMLELWFRTWIDPTELPTRLAGHSWPRAYCRWSVPVAWCRPTGLKEQR